MSCCECLAKWKHQRKRKRKLADGLALAKHNLLCASTIPSLIESSQLEHSIVAVQEFGQPTRFSWPRHQRQYAVLLHLHIHDIFSTCLLPTFLVKPQCEDRPTHAHAI